MPPGSGDTHDEADGVALPEEVTRALRDACQGEGSRWDEVLAALYTRLRHIAHRELRKQAGDHTIEPTALANEAWARLAGKTDPEWKDRTHFLAVAAVAMRAILVDAMRARRAKKRGGDANRITLWQEIGQAPPAGDPIDILDLHEALNHLATQDARQARIVELRFFGGLTVEEVARTLGVSLTTVESEWRVARAWLSRRLERPDGR